MTIETPDPRDIPILTDAVGTEGDDRALLDTKSVHAGVVTESLKLAESLLHHAAKDIEAILFERVLDQLRARLPEIVDRVLREHSTGAPAAHG